MNQNRISHLFGRRPCKCCRARRKLRRLAAEAKTVETIVGGSVEFLLPSVSSYLSGERRTARLFMTQEFEMAGPGVDLKVYAASELKRVALQMLAAADRLEGPVSA